MGYCVSGQNRKIFGYQIFIDNEMLENLDQGWLQRVKKVGEVESIRFNLDLNIPDLNGKNIQVFLCVIIQIYDREM